MSFLGKICFVFDFDGTVINSPFNELLEITYELNNFSKVMSFREFVEMFMNRYYELIRNGNLREAFDWDKSSTFSISHTQSSFSHISNAIICNLVVSDRALKN